MDCTCKRSSTISVEGAEEEKLQHDRAVDQSYEPKIQNYRAYVLSCQNEFHKFDGDAAK